MLFSLLIRFCTFITRIFRVFSTRRSKLNMCLNLFNRTHQKGPGNKVLVLSANNAKNRIQLHCVVVVVVTWLVFRATSTCTRRRWKTRTTSVWKTSWSNKATPRYAVQPTNAHQLTSSKFPPASAVGAKFHADRTRPDKFRGLVGDPRRPDGLCRRPGSLTRSGRLRLVEFGFLLANNRSACLSVCLSVSVRHKSVFDRNGGTKRAAWSSARQLLSNCSTLRFKEIRVHVKKQGHIPLELCPKLWTWKISLRKVDRRNETYSSTTVDTQSVINWTVVGQLSWHYLRAATVDR